MGTITGDGICRHARHGLGLVDCHGLYSVRRYEHGGAMFVHAYKWWIILRCCCAGAPVRLSINSLRAALMLMYSVDGVL